MGCIICSQKSFPNKCLRLDRLCPTITIRAIRLPYETIQKNSSSSAQFVLLRNRRIDFRTYRSGGWGHALLQSILFETSKRTLRRTRRSTGKNVVVEHGAMTSDGSSSGIVSDICVWERSYQIHEFCGYVDKPKGLRGLPQGPSWGTHARAYLHGKSLGMRCQFSTTKTTGIISASKYGSRYRNSTSHRVGALS